MRIISINVNGIHAAANNGLFDWLANQNADVICLQDTRAANDEVEKLALQLDDFFCFSTSAEQPGQAGVAILTRTPPKAIITSLGLMSGDYQGRFIQADFDKISIASLLFPSGQPCTEALAEKARFLQELTPFLDKQRRKRRDYIYSSSTYIAHQKIDVKFWRDAQEKVGFLPEERAWMDEVICNMGYIDALREVNRESDQFSWWPTSDGAQALNLGWRFDYQLLTPGLKRTVRNARLFRNVRFSEHAPLQVEYEWTLSM